VEKNERRSLKYIRLAAFLAGQPAEIECIRMSIPEIEEVVGERLPANARLPSWWRNDERRMHSRAWLTAGWKVSQVNGDAEVEFVRSQG
jgi:hypothetical protein